jgi:hypothetical protein
MDLDLTVHGEEEGSSPGWSTPARSGGSGLGDVGDAGVPGGGRPHDEIRGNAVISRAWSASRFASRGRRGRRLEVLRASVASGGNGASDFPAISDKPIASGDAPGQGE